MTKKKTVVAALLLSLTAGTACRTLSTVLEEATRASEVLGAPTSLQPLRVSPDQRYLVKADGTPFLYLADTAWELFHRLDREQADEYLRDRREKGFTVVQAVVLAELEGLTDPNPYGHLPLIDQDPARPNEAYFEHVDYIVDRAEELGIYVGMLPTWGDKFNKRWGVGPEVFTPANARAFGEYLGRRYRDEPIIWILGGDRIPEEDEDFAIIRAMAEGIRAGDGGANLMTFHPMGSRSSAEFFHTDRWLDFNMQQTGHGPAATVKGWEKVQADYRRTPVKPVIDGEPLYEDHPIGFREGAKQHGFSTDAHVRQRAYWHLFAGAAGVAYGHHAVWQMYAPGKAAINGPLLFWNEAIDRPGARQMRHVRTLMESRPMLSRVPDQSIVVDPLDGPDRIQAIRGDDHLFVYSGTGRPFTVNMGKISGAQVRAYWYNPRNGASTEIGTFDNSGTQQFTTQYEGLGSDWVLVLDDASRGYAAPGRLVPAGP